MTYSEKLKDPRWQKKRLKILERDDFTCTDCGDTESTLMVHHLKYSGDPWEIEDKYLITLCEICHESWHINSKACKELKKDVFSDLDHDTEYSILILLKFIKNFDKDFFSVHVDDLYMILTSDLHKEYNIINLHNTVMKKIQERRKNVNKNKPHTNK